MEFIANYSSDSEDDEVVKSKSRKSFTAEFKLKVIKHAKDYSVNSASIKFFGLNSSPTGKLKKRLQGGGRPLTFKDLDSQLAVWVRERRSKKLRISHSILQQQAVRMFNAEKDEEGFKGSRGWLIKFLARHNFRLRVPTTVCQKPPSDYVEKIVNFLLYVSEVRQKYNYKGIYAADETAVYLDPSGGKCIDERGATKHDKKYGRKLELCWKSKVWFDDELTSELKFS